METDAFWRSRSQRVSPSDTILHPFWTSVGASSRLADYGIDDSKLDLMVDKRIVNGPFGNFKKLQKDDVLAIYRMLL